MPVEIARCKWHEITAKNWRPKMSCFRSLSSLSPIESECEMGLGKCREGGGGVCVQDKTQNKSPNLPHVRMNAPMCVCAPHFRPLFSAPYTSLLPAGDVV